MISLENNVLIIYKTTCLNERINKSFCDQQGRIFFTWGTNYLRVNCLFILSAANFEVFFLNYVLLLIQTWNIWRLTGYFLSSYGWAAFRRWSLLHLVEPLSLKGFPNCLPYFVSREWSQKPGARRLGGIASSNQDIISGYLVENSCFQLWLRSNESIRPH